MVSVTCIGVRFSVMFHFMFAHYTFSLVWVAKAVVGGTAGPAMAGPRFWPKIVLAGPLFRPNICFFIFSAELLNCFMR